MSDPVTIWVPPADTTPPSAPGTLSGSGSFGHVSLELGPATDNVGVTGYSVYRSTSAGFTPGAGNRVASGGPRARPTTTPGSPPAPTTTASRRRTPRPTSAPSRTRLRAARSGRTPAAGGLADRAERHGLRRRHRRRQARRHRRFAGVQFKLDGNALGAEDNTAPYSTSWDTRADLNGPHTLTAVARDSTGNTATSSGVAVTVDNRRRLRAGLAPHTGFDEEAARRRRRLRQRQDGRARRCGLGERVFGRPVRSTASTTTSTCRRWARSTRRASRSRRG